MKKVAIILTCLALAGCTKDVKIASGGDVPVGFSPLTDAATKAVYLGEQNATYTGKGSTYETFKAYARYTDAPGTNPKTGGVEFFFISKTLEVFHLEISGKDFNNFQNEKVYLILVTDEVFQFEILGNVFNKKQSLNI